MSIGSVGLMGGRQEREFRFSRFDGRQAGEGVSIGSVGLMGGGQERECPLVQ